MQVTTLAYIAINKETNELFVGSRGQAAFNKIGALKNSMNQANLYTGPTGPNVSAGRYNYKTDVWEFYEIDSMTKEMRKINK